MYGTCPKILYTKVPSKMARANSADPDQTAPFQPALKEQSGQSTLFAIPLCILRKNYKTQNLGKKVRNKVFEILGHLP